MDRVKKFLEKLFKNIGKEDNRIATVFLVMGILVVLNFISANIFFRFDITENKDYSISKISKKTVKNLDDIVSIKAYFSKNLPPKYLNLQQDIKDILDEYDSCSGGKVDVSYIDPVSDEIKAELLKKQIPILRFNVMKNDAFQVVQGYIALAIEYGDKIEIIPMISNTSNLEYDITLALKKLVSENVPVLGIVSSGGTIPAKEMSYALSRLEEIYQIKSINLKEEEIADDIETLIIAGPKEKFSEDELKKIDKFVVSGKSLILLVDGVKVDRGMQVAKNDIGIERLLGSYGFLINNDLVMDTSSGRASFSQGFLNFMVDYPLWPKILPDNFNKNNTMVGNLSSLMLPWVSSIDRTKENEGFDVYFLAKTTSDAWAQKENYQLNPQADLKTIGESGEYNLALLATGKLKSAFDAGETDNAKMILVGDSDFMTNIFIEQNPDNLIFFQNLVDGLSLDEDLIEIRSGGILERPINPVKKPAKETIRYFNIFGMTIIVLIFGFLRYFLRKRSKLIDQV